MALSKSLILVGFLFTVTLVITSNLSARELAESTQIQEGTQVYRHGGRQWRHCNGHHCYKSTEEEEEASVETDGNKSEGNSKKGGKGTKNGGSPKKGGGEGNKNGGGHKKCPKNRPHC